MRSTGLRHVHVKYATARSILLILSAAWLSGCAGSSSSVKSAWQVPAPHPVFARILIVGISTDFNQRCAYEFSMASWFSGTSSQPVVSCNSMTPSDQLTRANIERVVLAQHVDAVLTSAIVTFQVSEQAGYKIPYYQVTGVGYATGPLGEYGVPVAFVQLASVKTLPTVTGDVHILTKLFDTRDATLVYTLDTQTKTNDLQSTGTGVDTITALISAPLLRDGVIH